MRASRTGAGLGVPVALACIGCCALPILITAGVLSGGAAVFLADRMPALAAVLAAATAGVFAWAAYRRSRRPGRTTTSEPGGCECATPLRLTSRKGPIAYRS